MTDAVWPPDKRRDFDRHRAPTWGHPYKNGDRVNPFLTDAVTGD